jgi:hypothetical protein
MLQMAFEHCNVHKASNTPDDTFWWTNHAMKQTVRPRVPSIPQQLLGETQLRGGSPLVTHVYPGFAEPLNTSY